MYYYGWRLCYFRLQHRISGVMGNDRALVEHALRAIAEPTEHVVGSRIICDTFEYCK